MITQAAPCCIYDVRQLNSSYRDTLNPVFEEGEQRTGHGAIAICNKGWKSYPTICNATVVMQLTVDYLNRKAVGGYGAIWLLNIRHGNGASVVVRAGESPAHGEGKQLIFFDTINGSCERHYEKSAERIKQSDRAKHQTKLQV